MKSLLPTFALVLVAYPALAVAEQPQRFGGFRERARIVGFSPDGNTLLAVGQQPEQGDASALVAYDLEAQASRVVVESPMVIQPAAVSPDFTRVAWYDRKASSLNVIDLSSGKRLMEIAESRFPPDELRFALDGKTLFEARRVEPVRVWDADAGKELTILGSEMAGHMWTDLTPDGKRLLIAGTDNGKFLGNGKGLLQVWDPAARKPLAAMQLQPETRICVMARIAPDGKAVVAAELGLEPKPQLTLWDAVSGKRRALLDDAVDLQLILSSGRNDAKLPIAFSADGSLLATMTAKAVKIWNASSGELKHALPIAKGVPLMIAAAPSGSVLAVSYGDPLPRNPNNQPALAQVSGHVQLWDAASGKSLATLAGSVPYPRSLAFAPDGARLAAASYTWNTGPAEVYVWDVAEWVPKQQIPAIATAPETSPVKFEQRTWTDATGKFQVKAKFVSLVGKVIKLERVDDGKVVSLPLDRLSQEDQRYAIQLVKKLADPRNSNQAP